VRFRGGSIGTSDCVHPGSGCPARKPSVRRHLREARVRPRHFVEA
jgi:hypothetical protein